MTFHRILAAASAFAMALGLAACGGAGGSQVATVLPPPPTPTTPPCCPDSYFISAPRRATTQGAVVPVLAAPGTPSFSTGPTPGTEFPMLQTVVAIDETKTIANGGTYKGSIGPIAVEASEYSRTVRADGSLSDVSPSPNLDWTNFGRWSDTYPGDWNSTNGGRRDGVFVLGYATPVAAVPTGGTANYGGTAAGSVYLPTGGLPLSGSASLVADFGTATVTGTLTGMTAASAPWNDIRFSSSIVGNSFSGNAQVTSAPGGTASLGLGGTGTIQGLFFGPLANEIGAVWTLFDGANAAIGTIGARRSDGSGAGDWDY